jgi:TM2 domain-containing membrane protein YozV
VQLGKDYADSKMWMLLVSIFWGVLCCIFGFGIVLRMKEGYFKEVFMITFLNNEMIVKNKRVESFL